MFLIIFDILWTSSIAFITYLINYGSRGTYYSDGVAVSKEEFMEGTGQIIFIFWIITAFLWIMTIRKFIRDAKTAVSGEECFGIIKGKRSISLMNNSKKELNLEVVCFIESEQSIKKLQESIAVKDENEYEINDCIKCKYLDNDINILSKVSKDSVPLDVQEQLINYMNINVENKENDFIE